MSKIFKWIRMKFFLLFYLDSSELGILMCKVMKNWKNKAPKKCKMSTDQDRYQINKNVNDNGTAATINFF